MEDFVFAQPELYHTLPAGMAVQYLSPLVTM